MSNENQGPLSITLDTTNATTVIPMVADGHMARWRFVNGSQIASKDGKPMLKFEYDLVAPAPNTEGGQIKPGEMGAKHFENIALFDKNTQPPNVPDWAIKRVSTRMDALLGTGDKNNSKGKPERPQFGQEVLDMMKGRELVAKMRVKTEGEFTNSEFAQVYFPGDIAA